MAKLNLYLLGDRRVSPTESQFFGEAWTATLLVTHSTRSVYDSIARRSPSCLSGGTVPRVQLFFFFVSFEILLSCELQFLDGRVSLWGLDVGIHHRLLLRTSRQAEIPHCKEELICHEVAFINSGLFTCYLWPANYSCSDIATTDGMMRSVVTHHQHFFSFGRGFV